MKIIITKLAQKEFNDAKAFYEIEQSGLGARFEKVIKQALLRIKQFPTTWPFERGEVRRHLVHKFPYKILYSIQKGQIVILAFSHFHRNPDYWIDKK